MSKPSALIILFSTGIGCVSPNTAPIDSEAGVGEKNSAVSTDPDNDPCFLNSQTTMSISAQNLAAGQSTTVSWTFTPAQGCTPSFMYLNFHDITGQFLTSTHVGQSGSWTDVPQATGSYHLQAYINGTFFQFGVVPVFVTLPTLNNHTDVRITRNDQQGLFLQAVGTAGAVVRIASNVDLDLSHRSDVFIAPGVQIIGEHDAGHPTGPRLFTTTFPHILFDVGGDNPSDNVRITGIGLDGGQGWDPADGDADTADGIVVWSGNHVEIDHNELYGWRGSAIDVRDDHDRISHDAQYNADTVHVHDNYIHHNQHLGENGYGVEVSYGAWALIDQNAFDYNRHAIAGDGRPGTGYIAQRNLVLPNGGIHSDTLGIVTHTHIFDMHGREPCWDIGYYCGDAGEGMDIEWNIFLYDQGTDIKLRGNPSTQVYVGHNFFTRDDPFNDLPGGFAVVDDAAMVQTTTVFHEDIFSDQNQFGMDPALVLDTGYSCDLDGDGSADQMNATGSVWWYVSSRTGRWTFLGMAPTPDPVWHTGADFNGDGTCDLRWADGTTLYSPPPPSEPCGSCGGTTRPDGSCTVATPPNLGYWCGACGGSGTIKCDGTCSFYYPPNLGQPCGGCGGTVLCDGSCSVPTPANYGQGCGSCGGTILCDGSCSVGTPSNVGHSCGHCGGHWLCDGTCSIEDPWNYGVPCGAQHGHITCDGTCLTWTP